MIPTNKKIETLAYRLRYGYGGEHNAPYVHDILEERPTIPGSLIVKLDALIPAWTFLREVAEAAQPQIRARAVDPNAVYAGGWGYGLEGRPPHVDLDLWAVRREEMARIVKTLEEYVREERATLKVYRNGEFVSGVRPTFRVGLFHIDVGDSRAFFRLSFLGGRAPDNVQLRVAEAPHRGVPDTFSATVIKPDPRLGYTRTGLTSVLDRWFRQHTYDAYLPKVGG
jgi:hypothetical protein